MWKFPLADAGGRVLESFLTSFGKILGITTYQKEKSLWTSISWVDAKAKTVLVDSNGDGSIEICDLLITADKKAGGSVTLHFEDASANTMDVVDTTVADGAVNSASNFVGKVQGWQGASLYYTIVATYAGSILITFVRHDKDDSKTYAEMALDNGW